MPEFTTYTLPRSAAHTVLGLGAWLKNTACMVSGGQAVFSPLHGDLSTPQARQALAASVQALLQQNHPAALARDLHPDFYSSTLAEQLAAQAKLPCIAVQHHVAHIAAVQAEHGVDSPVIGLALDGIGLGADGQAWGGELLWLDGPSQHWQRLAHLQPLLLAGGDAAATQAWRLGLAVLHATEGNSSDASAMNAYRQRLADTAQIGLAQSGVILKMLAQKLNCPSSTAAGRWFDAAAALLGVCYTQHFEAEAAIGLEQSAQNWIAGHTPQADALRRTVQLELEQELGLSTATWLAPNSPRQQPMPDLLDLSNLLNLYPLCKRLCDYQVQGQIGPGAAHFHYSLALRLACSAAQAAAQKNCTTVALGGGCFFNQILKSELQRHLEHAGLNVLSPRTVSCGDAGLALGQAWYAQKTPAPTNMALQTR